MSEQLIVEPVKLLKRAHVSEIQDRYKNIINSQSKILIFECLGLNFIKDKIVIPIQCWA